MSGSRPHCACGTFILFSLSLFLDQMRAYFTQLRQELGGRLVEKVFGQEAKPSKVWCFLEWTNFPKSLFVSLFCKIF